jgi:hypothetical protein
LRPQLNVETPQGFDFYIVQNIHKTKILIALASRK